MPENRKYFPHKSVLFCTARTEVGLPLVASLIMNFILWGILARARELYAVKVCHFVFMANHFHLLIVVDNPAEVSQFIAYVKGESAHAINRLLGRRQRTIWKDGYDSPIVLTVEDTIKCIRYIYNNPVKACLVNDISEYPGVSSWQMYVHKTFFKPCKRLSRDAIAPLYTPALSINEQKRLVAKYEAEPCSEYTFILEPDAWIECFPQLAGVDRDQLNNRIRRGLEKDHAKCKAKRKLAGRDVLGATSLRRESMTKEYEPKKFGKKMICLCFDPKLRKAFVKTYRLLCAKAKDVYRKWREGDLSLRIPPGLIAPGAPPLVSALPIEI